MWNNVKRWCVLGLIVASGAAITTFLTVTIVKALFPQTERQWVYYPSWSGDVMYYDKAEVLELNRSNGRDVTEIDSAITR